MKKYSRRQFLEISVATGSVLGTASLLPMTACGNAPAETVRDRLWIWGHVEGSYDNSYGLPQNSHMTPIQGAEYLGIPNIIMVRYGGKPQPPFDDYAAQYRNVKRLMWSFVGDAGSGTSQEEQDHVLELARKMPNITGLFMDDFFHGDAQPVAAASHCWLAENNVAFPVMLTFHFEKPVEADRLELTQTDWKTGDYRTSDVAVEFRENDAWKELGTVRLENRGNARVSVALPDKAVKTLRLRFLGTHDTGGSRSVGLGGVQLFKGRQLIDISGAAIEASSSYPGYEPEVLLGGAVQSEPSAAISVARLRTIRNRIEQIDRKCDIGVTLYTHQLNPAIRQHLDLCDVVSFWSWTADDLAKLPENFAKYQEIVPNKRTLLGIYMWDFGLSKPLPMDLMKMQCEAALKWLQSGAIEGMIFLASNICGMKIEAVEWSKRWIAEHGSTLLRQG